MPHQPPFSLTVSAAARAVMTPMLDPSAQPALTPEMLLDPATLALVRAGATAMLEPIERQRLARYGVDIRDGEMGGVPVKIARKIGAAPTDRLLINFHGGGFVVDSGSLTESIPIAGLTGIKVATVYYRLAPEHPFPAAVDDALAVYRDALTRHAPSAIGIFGTSAGAILTLQLLARLKAEGLPMPAAAGLFSGAGDLSVVGDCEAYLPSLSAGRPSTEILDSYCANTPRNDPLLSPLHADLAGLPPTMLMASTRDQLLSHTLIVDAALRCAGVEVDLRVYEGMMHAFWAWIDCPEADAALAAQATFLARHLCA
uniref:alpha/beta hydrolase n=1 Tax=uncultured Sphingomonas sp. TaxID=158754 RepID=UPI0035CA3852